MKDFHFRRLAKSSTLHYLAVKYINSNYTLFLTALITSVSGGCGILGVCSFVCFLINLFAWREQLFYFKKIIGPIWSDFRKHFVVRDVSLDKEESKYFGNQPDLHHPAAEIFGSIYESIE